MADGLEVIINATAGTGNEEVARTLAETFDACAARARIHMAREGEEIERLVRRACSNGARAIVAGGGDGTIAAVAARLVGTERVLGVLPLGTLNHFAKDLGVPLKLEDAARSICDGQVACVDVGEVNGHIFINNSGLGLYPRIVRRREKLQTRDRIGKWRAFFRAALAVLRRYPFLHVRLKADGKEIVRKTPFVIIGNNEYQVESFRLGARKCLDAGYLSLYVAHRTGRLGLIRLAVRALFGRLQQAKDFDALKAQEIVVETRRPKRLPVATDGEVNVMQTPLHYRVLPGALRVIVPKQESGV
jgi:diacylglycerol kinase family enzyme